MEQSSSDENDNEESIVESVIKTISLSINIVINEDDQNDDHSNSLEDQIAHMRQLLKDQCKTEGPKYSIMARESEEFDQVFLK